VERTAQHTSVNPAPWRTLATTLNKSKPDWIFHHDDKPSEAEVMPRLIAEFPAFRPRWEKHLESWKGKSAGSYNDIAAFAHFVVHDLYPHGDTADLQRAFAQMEQWLVNVNQNCRPAEDSFSKALGRERSNGWGVGNFFGAGAD
jgi:hypothetical protein